MKETLALAGLVRDNAVTVPPAICAFLGRILVGVKSGLVLLPRYFRAQILDLLCASQKLFQPWLYSRAPAQRLRSKRHSSGSAAQRNPCGWTLPTTMAAKAIARKAVRSTWTSTRS